MRHTRAGGLRHEPRGASAKDRGSALSAPPNSLTSRPTRAGNHSAAAWRHAFARRISVQPAEADALGGPTARGYSQSCASGGIASAADRRKRASSWLVSVEKPRSLSGWRRSGSGDGIPAGEGVVRTIIRIRIDSVWAREWTAEAV